MASTKQKPAADLAERLLAVMESQRALGNDAYPLTLQRLVELTDPQAPPELVEKAVGLKPFKDRAVMTRKKNLAALVALSADSERLAGDPRTLLSALEALCTAEKPLWPLNKVKAQIGDTKLRKQFEDAISRQILDDTLPKPVGFRLNRHKPFLFLHRIPPPPPAPPPSRKKPEAVLSEKLLAVLTGQRDLGDDAYPPTLQRIVELTDPQASPELVKMAIARSPFKNGAVLSAKENPAGKVVLANDVGRLAGDPQLLISALKAVCTPENALWPLSKVMSQVEAGKLRKAFEAVVNQQIRDNALPEAVGYQLVKNKPLLFLKDMPPRNPAEILAGKLLSVLEAQRQLGDGSYPLSLQRLCELTAPNAKSALIKKALAESVLQDKLLLIDPKKPEAPVALADDRVQFVASREVLEYLLRAKRKSDQNAFTVDSLLPKKSNLFQSFRETVNQKIESNALPPTIGWMWIGGKRQVFLLEDVHARRPVESIKDTAETPRPPETATDFGPRFDAAFTQFNRRNGDHNFVSLLDMRKALPMDAVAFNAELRRLRVAGRYTLSAAEGRHGLSPEEQTAGVMEDGSLLLYVSRKAP